MDPTGRPTMSADVIDQWHILSGLNRRSGKVPGKQALFHPLQRPDTAIERSLGIASSSGDAQMDETDAVGPVGCQIQFEKSMK